MNINKIFKEYCEHPYEWPTYTCISLVDAILESKGHEPTDSAKYQVPEYILALRHAIKDYGTMENCYEDILSKHPKLKKVEEGIKPYDIYILNKRFEFVLGRMKDPSRHAMLGIVGPDFGLYTFREEGMREVKMPVKPRSIYRCLP